MRPWMKSLALNKPGMVVLTCHPTMDVETGGAEVLGHSWVHCDLTSAWTTGEMTQEKEEKKQNMQRISISGPVAMKH